jgi:hypothetical protein
VQHVAGHPVLPESPRAGPSKKAESAGFHQKEDVARLLQQNVDVMEKCYKMMEQLSQQADSGAFSKMEHMIEAQEHTVAHAPRQAHSAYYRSAVAMIASDQGSRRSALASIHGLHAEDEVRGRA